MKADKVYVSDLDGSCQTTIDGKTNTSTTTGNLGNGVMAIAVNVLTNTIYAAMANQHASQMGVFAGATAFPLTLLDELMGPVSSVR